MRTINDALDDAGAHLEQFMRESRQRVIARLRAARISEPDIAVAMKWLDGEQLSWVDDGLEELRAQLIDDLAALMSRRLH